MDAISDVIYESLIHTKHFHYEHIVFALEAHAELMKQHMLSGRTGSARKQEEQVLARINVHAKETVRQELKREYQRDNR